jgi:hypothetical protein
MHIQLVTAECASPSTVWRTPGQCKGDRGSWHPPATLRDPPPFPQPNANSPHLHVIDLPRRKVSLAQLMGEEPHGIDGGDALRNGDICHLLASHAHTECLAIEFHEHGDWHASPAHRRDLRYCAIDDIS